MTKPTCCGPQATRGPAWKQTRSSSGHGRPRVRGRGGPIQAARPTGTLGGRVTPETRFWRQARLRGAGSGATDEFVAVSMQVHLLNCGSIEPRGANLLPGVAQWSGQCPMVSRCILIAHGTHLLLVDAGFGFVDVAVPWHRLGPLYLAAWRPALRASECAASQVEALGFDRTDVRDIVLTHLDPNCAGGLGDFPSARVHVAGAELEAAATARPSINARARYRPAQWAHGVRWRAYRTYGSRWYDFPATEPLNDLEYEVRLVDLPGHSAGHAGVAIAAGSGYLLHVGDAVTTLSVLESPDGNAFPIRRFWESAVEFDRNGRRLTADQLRHLRHHHRRDIAFVCSHDPKTPDLTPTLGDSAPA